MRKKRRGSREYVVLLGELALLGDGERVEAGHVRLERTRVAVILAVLSARLLDGCEPVSKAVRWLRAVT